jgi:hypothetical protein
MSRISVVVLTYNRRDNLQELLDGLLALDGSLREVIVVDNCSADGTAEMVAARYPGFLCIRTSQNEGVSARNHGVAAARGDIVVTLDDDLLGLSAAHLAWLADQFAENPHLGALNFHVVDFFTGLTCNWVHHRSADQNQARFLTYEITEGAVAVRRSAFLAIGGYCPEFFISHEGPDLAFRLMNAGFTVEYDGRVTLLHKHAQGSRDPWRFYYYDTRNHVWLAVRNMPWTYAVGYLARGLGAMAFYALRDGYFVWWAQGVRDAAAALPRMLATRNRWNRRTRQICREIDSHRPGFWDLVRRRIRRGGYRLDA